MFIRNISIKTENERFDEFPFNLEIIKNFSKLELKSDIVIFAGENGSGKSTILEALACKINSISVGRKSIADDETLKSQRLLAEKMNLSWKVKTGKGFFLRTEDFFNFSIYLRKEQEELKNLSDDYMRSLKGYGQKLAVGATEGQIAGLKRKYGEDLDNNSHGESFLKFISSRLTPNGIYILDEPEAPLSPLRQMTLISVIKDMIKQNCQFFIATHSPILMAIPGAQIFYIEQSQIIETAYEDIEHVKITKDFLNNPDLFLRHL